MVVLQSTQMASTSSTDEVANPIPENPPVLAQVAKGEGRGNMTAKEIPGPVQVLFHRGIELLWIRELRPYFQTVTREINRKDPKELSEHVSFSKAVLVGIKKAPKFDRIGYFVENWDLPRFVTITEALKKIHL